ncbi:ArnT family glycosyltransferase [Paenibacillus sp. NPDC056579]|uniref:ArnT family glycosyltransferase n=1 Tax=Paenibacillus sp. NPDC056579 TaxID=3345871 RepID=UPI0036C1456D
MDRKPRYGWLVTLLVFMFIAALRIPYITNSPYEYDSWRQSDTESIALNFIGHRFHILYPQLNYDGPLPNYVQLEFQITTWIIAILYQLFGQHYALARAVPILFFIGSAYFLYRIGKSYFSPSIGWLAVLIYGMLPVSILYSRAIMPESAALFFMLGAFYWFSEWRDSRKRWLLIMAGLFTALAISQKIPTIFVGIPMLWMAATAYRWRMFAKWELWLFAVIALLPPFLYFRWLSTIAEFPFVSGIASKHILPNLLTSITTDAAQRFFVEQLPETFTWYGVAMFVCGLLVLNWKRQYPIGIWAIAMIIELVTIVATIRFNYYLIFTGPLVALLGAKLFHMLNQWILGRLVSVAWLLLLAYHSCLIVAPILDYQLNQVLQQAEVVQKLTKPDDLIVVGTDDPSLLNASHRRGWRVGNTMPGDPVAELQYFVNHGAAYFVPLQGTIYGDDGTLHQYLLANYPLLEAKNGLSIYKLSK